MLKDKWIRKREPCCVAVILKRNFKEYCALCLLVCNVHQWSQGCQTSKWTAHLPHCCTQAPTPPLCCPSSVISCTTCHTGPTHVIQQALYWTMPVPTAMHVVPGSRPSNLAAAFLGAISGDRGRQWNLEQRGEPRDLSSNSCWSNVVVSVGEQGMAHRPSY